MKLERGTVHQLVGVLTVLVFLGTGQYMQQREPAIETVEPGLRMLFRSRHIYLLFAGLLNLVVGLRFELPESGWARRAGTLGSLLLLIAPVLFLAAFLVEAVELGAPGPLTSPAVILSFAATLLYAVGHWLDGRL